MNIYPFPFSVRAFNVENLNFDSLISKIKVRFMELGIVFQEEKSLNRVVFRDVIHPTKKVSVNVKLEVDGYDEGKVRVFFTHSWKSIINHLATTIFLLFSFLITDNDFYFNFFLVVVNIIYHTLIWWIYFRAYKVFKEMVYNVLSEL